MKSIKLLINSNGWEYSQIVTISNFKKYWLVRQDDNSLDSEDNPAPDAIALDNGVVISFESGFEVVTS